MRLLIGIAAAVLLLAGCGLTERLWSGPRELARLPAGAAEYRCDADKSLLVRLEGADQPAWIFFPDRGFRLDAVAGAAGTRYSKGRTSLSIKGDALFLEDGSTLTHANCRRV